MRIRFFCDAEVPQRSIRGTTPYFQWNFSMRKENSGRFRSRKAGKNLKKGSRKEIYGRRYKV